MWLGLLGSFGGGAMLRTHKVHLQALTQQEFGFVGDYIRVKSSRAPLIFENEKGEVLELSEGEDAIIGKFSFLRITNTHTADQVITIAIGGDGSKLTSSTVSGVVQVINGEIETVKNNAAHLSSVGVAASVGRYGIMQIYNPANSGKNLFINQILLWTSGAVRILDVGFNPNQLAAPATYLSNKKAGGIDSLCFVTRLDSLVLSSSLAGYKFIGAFDTYVNGVLEIPLKEPLMLPPAYGLNIGSSDVGEVSRASFQTTEEVI